MFRVASTKPPTCNYVVYCLQATSYSTLATTRCLLQLLHAASSLTRLRSAQTPIQFPRASTQTTNLYDLELLHGIIVSYLKQYLLVIEPAGLAAHHEVALVKANAGFVPDLRWEGHNTPNEREIEAVSTGWPPKPLQFLSRVAGSPLSTN